MSDSPLHAQVAHALGWDNIHERTGGHWWGREPHGGLTITIPRYDTSWCSAGPIISRLGISVAAPAAHPSEYNTWMASFGRVHVFADWPLSNEPLIAVSRLIVELHKQGKLPK